MKIELKNIKHSPSLSEETNAFTASLFVDGKKVADCSNRGNGGCTDIHATYIKKANMSEELKVNRAIIKEAEEYCKSLPPIQSSDFSLKMDLELYVDTELEKNLKKKDIAKGLKKLDRECVKRFVVISKKVLEGYKEEKNNLTWNSVGYKVPLVEVHQRNPEAFKAQVAKIQAELKGDEYIYNTNLPD